VTGETIKELSIQNLDQLSKYVPGLQIQEGGEQTGISVRGFGAGLNFGFDQSVGLFIDGIYAGANASSAANSSTSAASRCCAVRSPRCSARTPPAVPL
jgi:outer membrane receptor for ferrienterochelin and colicin